MHFRIVNKKNTVHNTLVKLAASNGHLLMHVIGEGRIMFVENISRKRMFAVGIYVRTSGSCEHSGEFDFSNFLAMPPATGEPAADRSRRPSSTTGPRYVRI